MKNRILITGIEGNLGKTLRKRLDELGHSYLGISRNSHNSSKIVRCDITKLDDVKNIIKKFKPDLIIHLAGPGGNVECEKNPKNAFLVNLVGLYNILESSKLKKTKIIFASTREVYGNVRNAKEDSLYQPINVNGTTKMLAEKLILNYNLKNKIPFIILRFTNFYGEDFFNKGISKMILDALRGKKITIFGGKQTFDLIHYEDACDAIIRCISFKRSDIFNVGSGNEITPLKLINKLQRLTKGSIRYEIKQYRVFEAKRFSIDISKATKILNFKPKHRLDLVLEKMFMSNYKK